MMSFKDFITEKPQGVVVNKKKSGEVSSIKYDVVTVDNKILKRSIEDKRAAYKFAKRQKANDVHVEIVKVEKDANGGRVRYKIRDGKWVKKKNPDFDSIPPCSSMEAFAKLEL